MNVAQQIDSYLSSLPENRRRDMMELHAFITDLMPGSQLWYLDGRNSEGKIVSNPNIGYGTTHITYADGSSRPFYQFGISANTVGISLYVMGLQDKKYLSTHFGTTIGKASVSGYCIKFKSLRDIHLPVLKQLIQSAAEQTS